MSYGVLPTTLLELSPFELTLNFAIRKEGVDADNKEAEKMARK
jgi:hypothetical protein